MKRNKKRITVTPKICSAFKILVNAGLSMKKACSAMGFSTFTGYQIRNAEYNHETYKANMLKRGEEAKTRKPSNKEASGLNGEVDCIRFGKYIGKPWKDVPMSYLEWLIGDKNTENSIRLKAIEVVDSRVIKEAAINTPKTTENTKTIKQPLIAGFEDIGTESEYIILPRKYYQQVLNHMDNILNLVQRLTVKETKEATIPLDIKHL